jgi:hypothetical protein
MRSLIKNFNRDIKAILLVILFTLFCAAGFTSLTGPIRSVRLIR